MLAPTVLDAHRLRYGLVRGHPTSKSQEQTVFRHPVSAGRIRDYHLFSAKDQSSVLSSIAGLLRSRGPIAVLFAVVAFVVSSLKACSLGALTHVREERLETAIPLFGNADAAPAITMEIRPLGLGAAPTHVDPNAVFGSVGAPVRFIDASEVLATLIALSAPAGSSATRKKARSQSNEPANPAVTIANGMPLRSGSYTKPAKPLSWDHEPPLNAVISFSATAGNSPPCAK